MKLERINTAKGFCAKRSQRIPELHRNRVCVIVWVFKFNVCDATYRLSCHSIYFTSHLYLNICAKHDIGIYSIYFTCYT